MKLPTLIVAVLVMATAFLIVGSVALAQSGASAPATGDIAVRDGINPGEVVVSWDAVTGATHYRIGYVNMETDYPLAKSSVTGDWINAFIYVDENARNVQVANGRAEYTVRRLEQGVRHAFTVLTSNSFVDTGAAGSVNSTFVWPPIGSRWEFHTVADRGGATAPTPGFDFVSMYPNCDAVRAHYPGGVRQGSPIYRPALDPDGDGLACEPAGNSGTPVSGGPLAPLSTTIMSSSTTASTIVELRLTIDSLPADMPVGSSIVLYLEDDFQEPGFISASGVYFVSSPARVSTGNGARVYATNNPEISTSDYFTANKDDIGIQVRVPDMCTNATDECEGPNGLRAGDTVTMVIQKSAGIRNPSEAGTHSVGVSILGPVDRVGAPMYRDDMINGAPLETFAKISLSDPDNTRGYEMTVTGFGFNNGTSALVYVLHDPSVTSDMLSGEAEKALCRRIVDEGVLAGSAIVGSDDRVAVTFEVTVPPFGPGNTNYLCMMDGEGRMSDTDVEDFLLEPTIRVVPSVVRTGDTVTVFAQDFPNPGATFTGITLAGLLSVPGATGTRVGADGSATATFIVPSGVIGTVRLQAEWSGTRGKSTKITIIQ